MCYEALVEGDTERPLAALLRGELWPAVRNGLGAAALVVAVALVAPTTPGAWTVAGAASGALVLGTVLHQAVLAVGVAALRWRANANRSATS